MRQFDVPVRQRNRDRPHAQILHRNSETLISRPYRDVFQCPAPTKLALPAAS
jgi:hypothetical protein